MAANHLPHSLALFDADLKLVKTFAAETLDGRRPVRACRRSTTRRRAQLRRRAEGPARAVGDPMT